MFVVPEGKTMAIIVGIVTIGRHGAGVVAGSLFLTQRQTDRQT